MTKSAKLAETDVFLLLKQKNETAFSYLYDLYAASLYGVVLREVKNSKLASEILKNTFLNIASECNTTDCIKQSLFAWLLRLMKKTATVDFNVEIDLKSLLLPQKANVDNCLLKNVKYLNDYNSPSFYPLNTTV